MPVVVTGADTPLGRAVATALVRAGVEVRATVRDRGHVAGLVALGVRTAVSDLVDPLRLGAVLEGAHTVVHVDGDDPLATWDLVLDAAEDTSVRRLVTVAPPDTPPPPPGAYEVVLVRTGSLAPDPALVGAVLDADRRRTVAGSEVVDL